MADCGFPRSKRLLDAAQYKSVFDNAQFKVSCRLFLILAVANQRPDARLGLVVAKKNVKLAVQRNRLKRLIREAFRQNANSLAGHDLVVMVRLDADKLPNQEISGRLGKLLGQLGHKVAPADAAPEIEA